MGNKRPYYGIGPLRLKNSHNHTPHHRHSEKVNKLTLHSTHDNDRLTMLIPKEDRKKIHSYLFQEGVLVAKKDFESKHDEIDTKNLYVIKALQSLTSRGYVKTQFSWQYYYYTLTDEGVEYLREWLHLPAEIVPTTHKKQARPAFAGSRPQQDRRPRGGPSDDGYRRRGADKEGAPSSYNPSFSQ